MTQRLHREQLHKPHPREEFLFSVVATPSHLLWALHLGKRVNFHPIKFFRTNRVTDAKKKGIPLSITDFVPAECQEIFVGPDYKKVVNDDDNDAEGIRNNTKNPFVYRLAEEAVPAVSFYTVSTSSACPDDATADLEELLKNVPSNVCTLHATQLSNGTISGTENRSLDTHRLACVRAARSLFPSRPCLVVVAGERTTHVAVDKDGRCVADGVGMGIGDWVDYHSSGFDKGPPGTPSLTQCVFKLMEGRLLHKEGRRTNTDNQSQQTVEESIVDLVVQDILKYFKPIVRQFIETARKSNLNHDNDNECRGDKRTKTSSPVLCATGMGFAIVEEILKKIEPCDVGCEEGTENVCSIVARRDLVHSGIQDFLLSLSNAEAATSDDVIRNALQGNRVLFVSDGTTRAGIVGSVQPGDTLASDTYVVRFDDGSKETGVRTDQLRIALVRATEDSTNLVSRFKINQAKKTLKLLSGKLDKKRSDQVRAGSTDIENERSKKKPRIDVGVGSGRQRPSPSEGQEKDQGGKQQRPPAPPSVSQANNDSGSLGKTQGVSSKSQALAVAATDVVPATTSSTRSTTGVHAQPKPTTNPPANPLLAGETSTDEVAKRASSSSSARTGQQPNSDAGTNSSLAAKPAPPKNTDKPATSSFAPAARPAQIEHTVPRESSSSQEQVGRSKIGNQANIAPGEQQKGRATAGTPDGAAAAFTMNETCSRNKPTTGTASGHRSSGTSNPTELQEKTPKARAKPAQATTQKTARAAPTARGSTKASPKKATKASPKKTNTRTPRATASSDNDRNEGAAMSSKSVQKKTAGSVDTEKQSKVAQSGAKSSTEHRPATIQRPATASDGASSSDATASESKVNMKEARGAKVAAKNPKRFIKSRVAKMFDGEIYFGTVENHWPASETEVRTELWYIKFDDGDEEDLDLPELKACLALYKKNAQKDKARRV